MKRLKLTALLLTCALMLSACATNSPVLMEQPKVEQARLAPAPAWVMEERQADFKHRMLNFCCVKQGVQTK